MKQIFLLILGGFMLSTGVAQDDEKAKKILSELSEETKGYKTMSIDFKLSIKSKDINTSQKGKAYTKGTKFFYKTDDREVYCDGESVWSFLKDENECYIDYIEDLEGGINPSEVMNIWEDNFRYQYIQESKIGETPVHEIKLFPKDPKNSKYHQVLLKIDKNKKQIKKAIIKTKDGVTLQFTINKLTPNQEISDSKFKWVKAKHEGVTEIDNR